VRYLCHAACRCRVAAVAVRPGSSATSLYECMLPLSTRPSAANRNAGDCRLLLCVMNEFVVKSSWLACTRRFVSFNGVHDRTKEALLRNGLVHTAAVSYCSAIPNVPVHCAPEVAVTTAWSTGHGEQYVQCRTAVRATSVTRPQRQSLLGQQFRAPTIQCQ
jgi:hypothetical protein